MQDDLTRRGMMKASAAAFATAAVPVRAQQSAGKIDTHHHFLPKIYVDAVGLDDLASVMPNKIAQSWSAEASLALMEQNGIAQAILSISSGPPIPNAGTLLRKCNDEGAALRQRHPGRFGNFASLPLPDISFILSHAGGTPPYLSQRLLGAVMFNSGLAEKIGDPMVAIRHFWFDLALSVSKPQIAALLAVADPTRITFGTDFPMAPPIATSMATRGLASATIDDGLRGAIGRDNAARLLKLG